MNQDADALSRAPVNPGPPTGIKPINFPILEMQKIYMRLEQAEDKFCYQLLEVLEGSNLGDRMVRLAKDSHLDNGNLFYKLNFNGYPSDFLLLPECM